MTSDQPSLEKLLALLKKLRSPEGCPWTRAQDFSSLRGFLQEEVYETLETLDEVVVQEQRGTTAELPAQKALCEELGDLLLEFAFLATIAEEKNYLRVEDIYASICNKVIRRHPHVFGDRKATSPREVARLWEEVKAQEKRNTPEKKSVLGGVPRRLPALARAQKVSEKAAANGFDWPDLRAVMAKVLEELKELEAELDSSASANERSQRQAHELGDLLFALTNLARFLRLSSEATLHQGVDRFQGRFEFMEEQMQQRSLNFATISRSELEALWEKAKHREKTSTDRK